MEINAFGSLWLILSSNSLGFNSLKHLEISALGEHPSGKDSSSLALHTAAQERLVFISFRPHCFVILLQGTFFP